MGFYESNDPTDSVKALKGVVVLRIGFNPTRSTSPCYNTTHACNIQSYRKCIHTQKWIHSEMGPVRQNPIQRTVRSVHMCVHCTVHNCYTQCIAQNRPDNFPSYPLHNHHCSDDVYLREGEKQLSGRIATVILADNCFSPLQGSRPHIFNRQKI